MSGILPASNEADDAVSYKACPYHGDKLVVKPGLDTRFLSCDSSQT